VCDALLAIQMERSIGILCPPGAVYYVVVTRVLEPRCTDEDEYVYSCHFTVHMPRLHAAWEVPLAVALHERRTVIRRAPHCTRHVSSVEVQGYKPGNRDEAGRGKGLVPGGLCSSSIGYPRAHVLVVGQSQRPLRHSSPSMTRQIGVAIISLKKNYQRESMIRA
jgi:hypothetical protein